MALDVGAGCSFYRIWESARWEFSTHNLLPFEHRGTMSLLVVEQHRGRNVSSIHPHKNCDDSSGDILRCCRRVREEKARESTFKPGRLVRLRAIIQLEMDELGETRYYIKSGSPQAAQCWQIKLKLGGNLSKSARQMHATRLAHRLLLLLLLGMQRGSGRRRAGW